MTERPKFPADFLWGAATSSHQVEGQNEHNDWWAWEQSGKAKDKSEAACDHWRRFRDDFALARSMGHNAHRFSVEWSRLEPQEGVFDEEAFKHYDLVLDSLHENHLEPILTLHHFTLPQWLSSAGGWLSSRSPYLFERFAARAAARWKNRVRFWMTINEPEIYVYKSYIAGHWPPCEHSPFKMAVVLLNLWRGHARAYRAIHAEAGKNARVGVAKNAGPFFPYSDKSFLDRLTAPVTDFLSNHLFIQTAVLARKLDFIGLNYYSRHFVRGFRVVEKVSSAEKNSLGWDIYPEGLYEVVRAFSRYRLPIIISENGICTDDDARRSAFLDAHLKNLSRAIRDGFPVFGYLYWSLLDNFEWADGFAPHFGLVEVDYRTQERRIRPSARHYSEIIRG